MPGPPKQYDARMEVTCEAWLKEAMEADAKRMNVSTNELVRMAMRLWLARPRKQQETVQLAYQNMLAYVRTFSSQSNQYHDLMLSAENYLKASMREIERQL